MCSYGTVYFTGNIISTLVARIVCSILIRRQYQTYSCSYNTAYTDACKTLYHTCIYNRLPEDEPTGSKHVKDTHCTIPVYTTVFLKMDLRVPNM